MLAVGVAGGIGSGKSTVCDLLVDKGAVLIDADQVARDVVQPGGVAYAPLVERFGTDILAHDGSIDRPALAKVAFSDPGALADLNAITHPAIGAEMARRRAGVEATSAVVLFAIPLLRPEHRPDLGLDLVVVVDTPRDVALERLIRDRGMAKEDAEARMDAQAGRDERLEMADYVLDNGGDPAHLEGEVERLWAWLGAQADHTGHA